MKNLMKFGLGLALCGMFVACDDSSSSASDESSSSSEVILSSSQNQQSSSSFVKDGSEYDASTNTLTDLRDGKNYKTVTIGEQTWMAENLNYAYNIPTSTLDSSSFCYNGDPDNCAKYGRLYTWAAAMDSAAVFSTAGKDCGYEVDCDASEMVRGACPEGWHLPSSDEWSTLIDVAGGDSTANVVLKSTTDWDGEEGNDSLGFSALSAGYGYNGGYDYAGSYAFFWSSTQSGARYAYDWYFYDQLYADDSDKNVVYSVRCVKD